MIKKAVVECTIETERGGTFRLSATTGNVKTVDGFEKVVAAALADEYSAFCTSTADIEKLRMYEAGLADAQKTISDLREEVQALKGTVEKYRGSETVVPGSVVLEAVLPRAEPVPVAAVAREIKNRSKGK